MADPMPTFTRILAVLACATTLGACAAQPGGSDRSRWSLVEELRIGGADDPDGSLAEVDQLAVDGAGNVYVPQSRLGTIRVFDADGAPVRDIGRRGSEPGEFDRLYAVGFVADTLYAIDFGHRSVTYFTTDGELVRSQPLSPPPADPPFFPGMPFAVFADGSMAPGTAWAATISMEELRRVPQLRVDPERQLVDTVAWVAYERTARRASYDGRPLTVGSPLSDDAFATFSADGERLAIVDREVASGSGQATFGVTVADGWGDTIYSRRYEYEPTEIADAVVDSVVALGAQRISGAVQDPTEAGTFVRSAMFLPLHYPPVSVAVFSESGELWLGAHPVPRRPQRWTIIDAAGEHVAEATLPERLRVMVIRGDSLWGVERDEAGVPYVVRYRVERE